VKISSWIITVFTSAKVAFISFSGKQGLKRESGEIKKASDASEAFFISFFDFAKD